MTSATNTKNASKTKSKGPELHFTPPALTPSQVLANGKEAAALLESPVMNLAFESTIKNIQDEWLSTAPEEMKRREWLYQKAQALGHVAIELSGFARRATEIDAEAIQREAQAQQDADIAQGFMQ